MTYLTRAQGVVQLDPWLEPFKESLKRRYAKAKEWTKTINNTEGGMEQFSKVSRKPRVAQEHVLVPANRGCARVSRCTA